MAETNNDRTAQTFGQPGAGHNGPIGPMFNGYKPMSQEEVAGVHNPEVNININVDEREFGC